MQNTIQLSLRAQIGLVLGVLLIFSLIATLVGYLASNQVTEKMAAFASESVVATGTVAGKHIDNVRPTAGGIWVYWLDLSFKTQDGATVNQSAEVSNSIYDKYEIGGPVQVTYVRSKPEWFYIPGDAPTQRDVGNNDGMFQYGAIASLLFFAALLGWLFVIQGDRAPAPYR